MNRRSFFARVAGLFVAAHAAPLSVFDAPEFQWQSHGITVGGINRATYEWWRNQYTGNHFDAEAMRRLYDQCDRG